MLLYYFLSFLIVLICGIYSKVNNINISNTEDIPSKASTQRRSLTTTGASETIVIFNEGDSEWNSDWFESSWLVSEDEKVKNGVIEVDLNENSGFSLQSKTMKSNYGIIEFTYELSEKDVTLNFLSFDNGDYVNQGLYLYNEDGYVTVKQEIKNHSKDELIPEIKRFAWQNYGNNKSYTLRIKNIVYTNIPATVEKDNNPTIIDDPDIIVDELGLHWEDASWGKTKCSYEKSEEAIVCSFEGEQGSYPCFGFKTDNNYDGGTIVVNMKVQNPDQNISVMSFDIDNIYYNEYTFKATTEYIEYKIPISSHDLPIYKYGLLEGSASDNIFYIKSIIYYPPYIPLVELPDCKTIYKSITFNESNCNGKNPINYCINSNNGDDLIYGVNVKEKSCSVISLGSYTFSVSSDNQTATMVTETTTDINSYSLVNYECKIIENQNVKKCQIISGKENQNNNTTNNYNNNIEYPNNENKIDNVNQKGKTLSDCTTLYSSLTFNVANCNGKNPVQYCKYNDMIYGVNESGNECTLIDLGTYVFSITESGATLVTSTSTNVDENSLVIYQCSTYKDDLDQNVGSCLITSGYVIIDSSYYAVPSSKKQASYRIDTSSGLSNSCSMKNEFSYVGTLINNENTIGVCYDDAYKSIIQFPNSVTDNKNYFIYGNKYTLTYGPFSDLNTSGISNSGIIVASLYGDQNKNPTMIYFDKFYSAINYCYSVDDGELINRIDYLCKYKSSTCVYYYCNGGICKESNSTCPQEKDNVCLPSDGEKQAYCDDGYHVVTEEYGNNNYIKEVLASTEMENGFLYYCENGVCNNTYNQFYGFFENGNIENKNLYPYIKCTYSEDYRYNYNLCRLMPKQYLKNCKSPGDLVIETVEDSNGSVENLKICLDNKTNVPLKSENISFKLVKSNIVSPENKYDSTLVMLDKNSIHTISNDGYLLVDKNSLNIYTESNKNGTIYSCYGLYCYEYSGKIGFFYNILSIYIDDAAPYIKCERNNGCSTINITKNKCSNEISDVNAVNGELFKTTEVINGKESEVFNLCLTTINNQIAPIQLNDTFTLTNEIYSDEYYKTSSIEVMISTNNINSVFGYKQDSYILAKIENKSVFLLNENNVLYKHTSKKFIVFKYGMPINGACNNPYDYIEFELICPYDENYDNTNKYYRLSDDNQF